MSLSLCNSFHLQACVESNFIYNGFLFAQLKWLVPYRYCWSICFWKCFLQCTGRWQQRGEFCFEKLVLTLFLFIACVFPINIWEGFPDAIVDTVGQRNPFWGTNILIHKAYILVICYWSQEPKELKWKVQGIIIKQAKMMVFGKLLVVQPCHMRKFCVATSILRFCYLWHGSHSNSYTKNHTDKWMLTLVVAINFGRIKKDTVTWLYELLYSVWNNWHNMNYFFQTIFIVVVFQHTYNKFEIMQYWIE